MKTHTVTTQNVYNIWYLQAGGALTHRANRAELLLVTQGRIWATQTGSNVDLFACKGQSIRLSAGQTVVLEGWPTASVEFQALEQHKAALTPWSLWRALIRWISSARAAPKQNLVIINSCC